MKLKNFMRTMTVVVMAALFAINAYSNCSEFPDAIKGVMVDYTDSIDGCGLMIESKGRVFNPQFFTPDLEEGDSILFAYNSTDSINTCMVGTTIELICFELIAQEDTIVPPDTIIDTLPEPVKECNTLGVVADLTGLDGCGLVIKTDTGTLEPHKLPEGVKLNAGDSIMFSYTLIDGAASICMVGPIISVDCYKVIGKVQNPISYHQISGSVIGDPDDVINDGIVIAFIAKGGRYYAVEKALIEDGKFTFPKLVEQDYILQAVPFNKDKLKYLPTYYVNKLSWKEAAIVTLDGDIIDLDIQLVYHKPRPKTGVGSISGTIKYADSTDYEKRIYQTDWSALKSGANLAQNIPVLLLDSESNVIDWTLTNANGEYEFASLENGIYTIRVEKAGVEEISEGLTIDDSSSAQNANLELDEGSLALTITSIALNNAEMILFPNPFDNVATLQLSETFEDAWLNIYNTNGQLVYNQKISSEQVELDASNFNNGIFMYRVTAEGDILGKGKFIVNK